MRSEGTYDRITKVVFRIVDFASESFAVDGLAGIAHLEAQKRLQGRIIWSGHWLKEPVQFIPCFIEAVGVRHPAPRAEQLAKFVQRRVLELLWPVGLTVRQTKQLLFVPNNDLRCLHVAESG